MMMKYNIFISAPISGFCNSNEYNYFRSFLLKLIKAIRKKGFEVCSEVEIISTTKDYSCPTKSVQDDFMSISKSDIFLFCHPKAMQSSSLIELGFACALNKQIVLVGKVNDLPYLARGLQNSYIQTTRIDLVDYSDSMVSNICSTIEGICT